VLDADGLGWEMHRQEEIDMREEPVKGNGEKQGAKLYCTFHVADMYIGVDVEQVQEVLRAQEMTRVPLAPPVLKGLINLRGQIVTAIDMRRRLGMQARDTAGSMNVVIRSDEGPVSLLVDEIDEVVTLDQKTFEATPENLQAECKALLSGVHKLQGRLLFVLNTDSLMSLGKGMGLTGIA
jgi:purine-binding chemotaxis protein CheW